MVAVSEYVFLGMVLTSYAIDIAESKALRLTVTCSAEDAADYGNVSSEPKANVCC